MKWHKMIVESRMDLNFSIDIEMWVLEASEEVTIENWAASITLDKKRKARYGITTRHISSAFVARKDIQSNSLKAQEYCYA